METPQADNLRLELRRRCFGAIKVEAAAVWGAAHRAVALEKIATNLSFLAIFASGQSIATASDMKR